VSISSPYGQTVTDWGPLAGREHEHRVNNIDGTNHLIFSAILRRTWTDYGLIVTATSPSGVNSYLAVRTIHWTDEYGTAQKVTRTDWFYDGYGNAYIEFDYGDYNNANDDRRVDFAYAPNTTAWIVDKPFYQTDRATLDPNGPLVAHRDWAFDTQGFGAPPTRGNATIARQWIDGAASTQIETTFDGNGRPTIVKDPLGNPTTTAYDALTGFPRTITNPANQPVTTVVDVFHGGATTVTDPNNHITSAGYDALGRITDVWYPTEQPTTGTPSAHYAYDLDFNRSYLASIRTSTFQDAGQLLDSQTWVDGLGREVQTEVPAVTANKRVLTSKYYDIGGRQTDNAGPYTIDGTTFAGYYAPNFGAIPVRHYMIYDSSDRPTNDKQYNLNTMLWQTASAYDGWKTTVTPPRGGDTATTVDGYGRTAQTVEFDSGQAGNATTNYQYDADGRLIGVDDAATPAHHTQIAVDYLGRKTSMTDPDMGSWVYTYDAASNLVTQKDANNHIIWFGYDNLERKTQQRQTSSNGALLAQWTYDASNQLGLLNTATSFDAAGSSYTQRSTAYDAANHPTAQQWEINPAAGAGFPGGTYKTTAGYDHAGHLTAMAYPSNNAGGLGETVTAHYNGFGRPDTLTGTNNYVTGTNYSDTGQLLTQTFGSTTAITRTLTYDSQTLRLTALKAGTGTGAPSNLENFSYTYDNASNIATITDGNDGNQRQCYGYDDRQRLTSAMTGTNNCGSYDSTRGTNEYKASWRYNNLGNVTQDTLKLLGGAVTTNDHTFDPNHPHAPNLVGTNAYGYDANGNQTSRNGTAVALTWDFGNHMTAYTPLVGTAQTYGYDADGNRIRRTTGTTTVFYLGAGVEATSINGATPTITKYYTLGGQRISLRNTVGLYYVLADHLGSAYLTYRADGGQTSPPQRYLPYGGIRGTGTNGLVTDRDFTGQTLDPSTGLTHMGARDYDPTTQTFTSADTITPGAGSKALNRYAYVNGNPIIGTDPTGHMCFKDDGVRGPCAQAAPAASTKELSAPGSPNAKQIEPSDVADFFEGYYGSIAKQLLQDAKGEAWMVESAEITTYVLRVGDTTLILVKVSARTSYAVSIDAGATRMAALASRMADGLNKLGVAIGLADVALVATNAWFDTEGQPVIVRLGAAGRAATKEGASLIGGLAGAAQGAKMCSDASPVVGGACAVAGAVVGSRVADLAVDQAEKAVDAWYVWMGEGIRRASRFGLEC
jgi:RHS repeat-associated protein